MKISPATLAVACVLSLLIGVGATWLALSEESGTEESAQNQDPFELRFGDQFMDEFFDDHFFDRSRDPFREMDRMQKRLEEELFNLRGQQQGLPGSSWFGNRFDDWFSDRFGDRRAGTISMREDDEFFYYELDLGDEVSGDVDVSVDDNYITITAETQAADSEQRSGSSYESRSISRLSQRFPMPANGDPESVDIDHGDGVVTIRIGKLS